MPIVQVRTLYHELQKIGLIYSQKDVHALGQISASASTILSRDQPYAGTHMEIGPLSP